MASLLGIGLYTCLCCGEHLKGTRTEIQEFVAEHMCPCENDKEKITNLKKSITVLNEHTSGGLAVKPGTSSSFVSPAQQVLPLLGNQGKFMHNVTLSWLIY